MNKNKRGFTLMELLVVIAIVSIVSVGATIAFSNINDSTAEKELENPVTGDDIDLNNYVKLYVPVDNSKVDSCIISIDESGNEKCIANSRGKRCGCCDLEINPTTNPACN